MPGKMTRPDDGRRNNRGVVGNKGGGRPKGSVSERGQRAGHQIRAYEEEWEVIRAFIKLTRKDLDKSWKAVKKLEQEVDN